MDCVLSLQRETCACSCFLSFDSEKKPNPGWAFVFEVQPSYSSDTTAQGVGPQSSAQRDARCGHHLWWLPVPMAARGTLGQPALSCLCIPDLSRELSWACHGRKCPGCLQVWVRFHSGTSLCSCPTSSFLSTATSLFWNKSCSASLGCKMVWKDGEVHIFLALVSSEPNGAQTWTGFGTTAESLSGFPQLTLPHFEIGHKPGLQRAELIYF